MAQQAQVKNYWTFIKGFVTETGPLIFPENTALSLDNIVLDTDGSIVPRQGFVDLSTLYSTSSTDVDYERGVTTYQWKAAGGQEADDLYVLRAGRVLRFFTANATPPVLLSGEDVDLSAYIPAGSVYTATDVDSGSCSMAAGDGRLFVVTPYTDPLLLTYDKDTGSIDVTPLTIRERDLEGVDDGLEPDEHSSTLTSEYNYNLRNAGWNGAKLNEYKAWWTYYPSRSEDPWTGVIDRVYPATGRTDRIFDPELYKASGDIGFGTSEAAKGKYILETFNTNVTGVSSTPVANTAFSAEFVNPTSSGGGLYDDYDGIDVSVTTASLIITPGETATIEGTAFDSGADSASLNGSYIAASRSGNTYTFFMTRDQVEAIGFDALLNFTVGASPAWANDGDDTLGTTDDSTPTLNVGFEEDKRFEAVAFYAGRVFYAGCQPDTRKDLAGRVYYSQIIKTAANASKAYQANDPSAKDINDLLDTDGGYITINNLGVVHAMVPFRQSLIVIATNGCWEIGVGESIFTPKGYSVRQLTERGSKYRNGIMTIDGRPCYWSSQGLEVITESEITSFPTVQSLTDETIKSFVQQDIVAGSVSCTYDNVDNRAYWSFQLVGDTKTTVLVFDLRLGAFYTWSIDNNGYHVRSIDHFDNDTDERLRLVVQSKPSASLWQLDLHSQDHATGNTDYLNSTTEIQFSAFIEAGYELNGDAMRKKQAIKVGTFCERDANSSLFARGKYEWSNNSVSGKWNNLQQAYRDAGEGHSVSVSRLRMRGSGRAFRIRYESDGTAPFKLYGWSIFYTGVTNV